MKTSRRDERARTDVERAERQGRQMAQHIQRTSEDRELDSLKLLSARAARTLATKDQTSPEYAAAEQEYADVGRSIAKIRVERAEAGRRAAGETTS